MLTNNIEEEKRKEDHAQLVFRSLGFIIEILANSIKHEHHEDERKAALNCILMTEIHGNTYKEVDAVRAFIWSENKLVKILAYSSLYDL